MNAHEPARTEVLVVGAGPAGMAAAASLSDQGVETMVVDKRAEMMNTSRAAVVHARTLEVLEELGVTGELVARGIRVSKFTVREHNRVLLHIDFDQLPSAHPYTLLVPQDITEQVLLKRLHKAGGQVTRPSEVTALAQDPAGVTVTLATGEQIRAGYVIGADGMHSLVREQAGITFHGDSYPQSFVLADVVLTGDVTDAEVRLYFAPEGVSVLAPLPGGRHRIVATVDDAPPHPDRSQVQALLDARGPRTGSIEVTDLGWSSRFRVHHRLADRYRAGRVFLAGDAAHVHSPAGGQGMNTGIQDALDLARRLGAVLRDGAPDSTLDGYEAERRPVAEEIVAFTDKMTRAATLGSPALRAMRNTAMRTLDWLPAVHRKMALTLSELKTGH
ncbi:pentachlorophenol monooxygenase [Amycolatopsis sp. A1MSW2902]|uniref:FAD-dependent oxidoreductase n=1 Tax=Amycolatopsis sp. A1MSW2902 TaxID=687413 RepID=UPI00307D722E